MKSPQTQMKLDNVAKTLLNISRLPILTKKEKRDILTWATWEIEDMLVELSA